MNTSCIVNRLLPLSRLGKPVINTSLTSNIHTASYPLAFQVTPCLLAEPPKKKKVIDPAVVRAKIEKKKNKIDKMIRKLQRSKRHLKPIEEEEEPDWLENEEKLRRRKVKVPENVEEERIHLDKKWANYCSKQWLMDSQMIDRLVYSQQKALDELRLESEELYQAAIQLDDNLLHLKFRGPSETPAIKDFDSPDGDYIDLSRDWSKEVTL